jgi:hypothetical protein
MKDYYSLLGVRRNASPAEIKRAYRLLAVRYHPDKNPDPEVAELFKEITEAYNVLSDSQAKMMYDLKWSAPFAEPVAQEPQRRHRDPRYRPRPAGVKVVSQQQRLREAMQKIIPFVSWICWASVAVPLLLAVDYFLPYRSLQARVESYYDVQSPRSNSYMYSILTTDTGDAFKLYGKIAPGNTVFYEKTIVYGTVMYLSTNGETIPMAYAYGAQGFMAIGLFIMGMVGVLLRNRIETHFNCCVMGSILLVINLYLIL